MSENVNMYNRIRRLFNNVGGAVSAGPLRERQRSRGHEEFLRSAEASRQP